MKETVTPPNIVFSASQASQASRIILKKIMAALGTDRVLKSWFLWNRYTEYPPLESPALSLEYLCAKKFCCFQINFAYHG